MKLLFYAPQMAAYGGIERHVCSLAAAAAAQGHTVRLITTGNSLGLELRRALVHPLISFHELPQGRGLAGPGAKFLWLMREVRQARSLPWDVIYTNGQSGLARLVWSAADRFTRIIHHHHTAADANEQATWSRLYRHVLRRAPHLVGCSRATCRALNAATGRTNAHFLPYLTPALVEQSQINGRTAGPQLHFGFCGRLIPEKGIDTILTLAESANLADITWHIHGAGEAYPPARFAALPRLRYHGAYHSATEQAAILLALDALVLFSIHNEGMPLSLIEGMAAGLPWIATDRGGTREIAVSPEDCVVVPADASVAELVIQVRALADRIAHGATLRLRQRAGYDAHFAPPVVTDQWLDFFRA